MVFRKKPSCPASRSLKAGPVPRYGTGITLILAIWPNISEPMWVSDVRPGLPKVSLPGLARP